MNYTQPDVYEFISKQTNDPIVERKICRVSGTKFAIFQSDLEFYEKISPVFGGKKYSMPIPTLAPEERQLRRLAFRNERKLYKRQCDATDKSIISNYTSDSEYKVYENSYRFSDAWDAMDYGIDVSVDVQSTFVDLWKHVPKLNLVVGKSENSSYCNYAYNDKNCYMCSTVSFSENCFYSSFVQKCSHCIDCTDISESEKCYGCVAVKKGHNLQRCVQSVNCFDSKYLYNCENCHDCISCSNLVNKSYCIQNIQYTPEEYHQLKGNAEKGFLPPSTYRGVSNMSSENVFGDGCLHSFDASFCFNGSHGRHLKYVVDFAHIDDAMDVNSFGYESSWNLECISGESQWKTIAMNTCAGCKESYYCDHCFDSNHLFGCVGLRNKSYCIFNKQYTKEEYEKYVPKIIAQMQEQGVRGSFFEPSLSPFAYNETVAADYFPLSESEAKERGFSWKDADQGTAFSDDTKAIIGSDLPTGAYTGEVDDLVGKIILCEQSEKPFRFTKQELLLYKKFELPLPTTHPDVRYNERNNLRSGRMLSLVTCSSCTDEMVTVFGQLENQLCENCYKNKVYS